jgi:hypothetical protein
MAVIQVPSPFIWTKQAAWSALFYDPAASYNPKGEKGSGNVMDNKMSAQGPSEVEWSLADYIKYHSKDGSMSFVPIWTDSHTVQNLEYPSNTMGGFCAVSAGDVVLQIPGLPSPGYSVAIHRQACQIKLTGLWAGG